MANLVSRLGGRPIPQDNRGDVLPASLSNEDLNELRSVGDPPADAVIASLLQEGDIQAVNRLMRTLVENEEAPAGELPPVVLDYLQETSSLILPHSEQVARGQALFARLGPEMLAVLGFYGLPMDYAAGRGVQVLYRTSFLLKRSMRRVLETTQMVIDVMAEGGLGPQGRGVRTAQKVRLMHAAVRHLAQNDSNTAWDTSSLGVPINQEDLAGTLMTFAYVVLAGLERLGLPVSSEEREAYFHCWMAIGRLMGVRPELIPSNVEEGELLARRIFSAQAEPTEQGQELGQALIEGYQGLFPTALRGLPASMMQLFLEHESISGQNVAALLAIPPADWTTWLGHLAIDVDRFLEKHSIDNPLTTHLAGVVGKELISAFIRAERGGNRPSFSIPEQLHEQWGTTPALTTGGR